MKVQMRMIKLCLFLLFLDSQEFNTWSSEVWPLESVTFRTKVYTPSSRLERWGWGVLMLLVSAANSFPPRWKKLINKLVIVPFRVRRRTCQDRLIEVAKHCGAWTCHRQFANGSILFWNPIKLLIKWDLGSGLVIRGIPSWQCTSRGWDWFKNLTYLHFLWVTHSFFYRLVIHLNVGYSSAPGSVGYNFNKSSSRSKRQVC